MAVFVDPSVPVKSLVDLLLKPFRVLQRIKEVEEDVPFLHGRVLVLDGTLKSIREDTRFDGDGWQTVMPEERWQKLHESLQVFEKILEKADNLAKKIDQYKGRLKMWVYAKGLKTSLEDSHVELDRVDQGLANVRTLLGEPEPSKKQQQVDQLRRISLEGRPVEPVEDAPQKSAETNEDCIRYNKKKLEFLEEQMVPMQLLEKCIPPGSTSPQAWTESMVALRTTLESANKFIKRHSCPFNLQTFCTTQHAKMKIEKICNILKSIADEYEPLVEELKGVKVLDKIPKEAVDDDWEDLRKKLSFVLKGDHCHFPPSLQAEWEAVKRQHDKRVSRLQIIDESKIVWVDVISECTHYVTYYGLKATAKRMIQDGTPLGLEDFAKFYTEAAIIDSLNIQWVARLIGISQQGLMVVEGGDKDLMQWYRELKSVDWQVKVRVMWEAAQGLLFVHDQQVMHCSVSSQSFHVFPGDSIKITNFSSATEITEVKSLSRRRQHAQNRWIAPEIYSGAPHSLMSDVYSFGVVMHEVAALSQPYGVNPTEAELLITKLAGEPPCAIPGDCPQVLRDLMAQCCSATPGERPTMAHVVDRLSDVQTQLIEAS